MQPINRPEVPASLRGYFAVNDAGYVPQLGGEIVPTAAITPALEETPYGQIFRQAQRATNKGAGGAGTFAFVGVAPEASSILQVLQLSVANDDAAVTFNARFAVLTAAQFAAATSGAVTDVQMLDVGSKVAGTLVGSLLRAGLFTSATPGVQAGYILRVAPGQTLIVDIPRPGPCLFGTDAGGVPWIGLINQTQAMAIRCGWVCREWPVL